MRTTVNLTLDIVHELPLAMSLQEIAGGVEQGVTRWELMGQRDPKLSVRATLTPALFDHAEAILVASALRAHAEGVYDPTGIDKPEDPSFLAVHRANSRELARIVRMAANKIEGWSR